ncbi:MAG: cardiolipin synthetase family protein [Clostridiales bacterium]|jgi:cardiolipin synthase|nr:cardiolipin synthetase family protein [Clostridiales bacterium]
MHYLLDERGVSMRKLLKFLTSRIFIIGMLILIQAILIMFGINVYSSSRPFIYWGLRFISLFAGLYIITQQDNPMYKLVWIITILGVPLFGGVFYLFFGKKNSARKLKKYMKKLEIKTKIAISSLSNEVMDEIKEVDLGAYRQVKYIYNKALAPIYKNTYTKFLTPGEIKLETLMQELRKAKKYIFLEYYIIEKGVMWDSIVELLKLKVIEGVEVKLMYDDFGTITTLSSRFRKEMISYGIETKVFNEFKPSLDAFMNYRDHRKICIIDGNVGFTGGINLADEYINVFIKYGHWKDASIILKGEAVWNLTILFLQTWYTKKPDEINFIDYLPTERYESNGYVQPFGDSPIDDDLVGETTYMNIINNAKKYVFISTPYLVIDHEMMTSLTAAAQSGIDVRITTPHIPDKWFVHEVSRSNYKTLIEAGVKIYEYTPGFIHSKTIVSDDEYAIVGTTNFDFRSFYLHFECGVFLYKTDSVYEVRDDYFDILKVSKQVSIEECNKIRLPRRLVRAILSVFSPLM